MWPQERDSPSSSVNLFPVLPNTATGVAIYDK